MANKRGQWVACMARARSATTVGTCWDVAAPSPLPDAQQQECPLACPSCSSFCHPQVCLAHADGELAVVAYGSARALAACRTAHFNAALLSLRLPSCAAVSGASACQRMAYLGDARTVHIRDLVTGADVAVIRHGSRIDWLVCDWALSSAWVLWRRTIAHMCTHKQSPFSQ